jgi:hypothetical protein
VGGLPCVAPPPGSSARCSQAALDGFFASHLALYIAGLPGVKCVLSCRLPMSRPPRCRERCSPPQNGGVFNPHRVLRISFLRATQQAPNLGPVGECLILPEGVTPFPAVFASAALR